MSLIPQELKPQFESLHSQVEDINIVFYDLALALDDLQFEAARSKLHGQITQFYSEWGIFSEKLRQLLSTAKNA